MPKVYKHVTLFGSRTHVDFTQDRIRERREYITRLTQQRQQQHRIRQAAQYKRTRREGGGDGRG